VVARLTNDCRSTALISLAGSTDSDLSLPISARWRVGRALFLRTCRSIQPEVAIQTYHQESAWNVPVGKDATFQCSWGSCAGCDGMALPVHARCARFDLSVLLCMAWSSRDASCRITG
jgi:hypothetical protein